MVQDITLHYAPASVDGQRFRPVDHPDGTHAEFKGQYAWTHMLPPQVKETWDKFQLQLYIFVEIRPNGRASTGYPHEYKPMFALGSWLDPVESRCLYAKWFTTPDCQAISF